MSNETKTFMVEDAELMWRNFEGREGPYNTAGSRNFCVKLDPVIAEQLADDGWNIKYTKEREDGDVAEPYIQVNVNFKIKPPRVVMITSNSRVNLNDDTVSVLDWADIAKVDLICNAYDWNVGGKTGTKAYLKSLFVTIEEDALERKYGINEMPND